MNITVRVLFLKIKIWLKASNWLRALYWLALGFMSNVAYSFDNFCIEKRWPSSRPSAWCQGMVIPYHKTRNFLSEELRCSSSEDTHTRKPVAFDEEAWRDLHNTEPDAAKKMLRELPIPLWESTVPYDTHLHWSWEECQLVTSYACGTERVCKKVLKEVSEEDSKREDKDEECHDEPRSCYTDVTVSDSAHCSHEQLTYDVEYLQVDKNNDTYIGRLANGFDLLPGEEEGVKVDNGIGFLRAASMSPRLSIVEPRNDYLINRKRGDQYSSASLMCRQNTDYRIGFTVLPQKRIRSRSGNGFSLPESFDGESIDPLVWKRAKDSYGKWKDKGYPAALRVQGLLGHSHGRVCPGCWRCL